MVKVVTCESTAVSDRRIVVRTMMMGLFKVDVRRESGRGKGIFGGVKVL